MLKSNLDNLFKLKAENKKIGFLMKNGFSQSQAQHLALNKTKQFSFDTIYKLCLAFNCLPNDLFEFIPDKSKPLSAEHPLNLLKSEPVPDVSAMLKSMSVRKLIDLSKQIKAMK